MSDQFWTYSQLYCHYNKSLIVWTSDSLYWWMCCFSFKNCLWLFLSAVISFFITYIIYLNISLPSSYSHFDNSSFFHNMYHYITLTILKTSKCSYSYIVLLLFIIPRQITVLLLFFLLFPKEIALEIVHIVNADFFILHFRNSSKMKIHSCTTFYIACEAIL